jgi:hypothetical protein
MLFLQQEAAALGLAAERVFGKATEHSGQRKDVEKTLRRAAVARDRRAALRRCMRLASTVRDSRLADLARQVTRSEHSPSKS